MDKWFGHRDKGKEKWKSYNEFSIFATLGFRFTTKYVYGSVNKEYQGAVRNGGNALRNKAREGDGGC